MTINIITGNAFSQRELISSTNNFFNSPKHNLLITSKSSPYVIKIGKRSIKFLLSDQCKKEDYSRIKKFIETIFKNSSILIVSNGKLNWIDDIENVIINTINI